MRDQPCGVKLLPFSKKQEGSASMPVQTQRREHDEDFEYDSMEIAAEELCHAIEKKDYKAIATALRSAFELMDSEPHYEGEHTNE